jgi:cobalamin biosynthesis protein CobT
MSTVVKKKIILKKLKSHNTVWHPDSGLVFKSLKEREVIGRYNKQTDIIIPFDDDIFELCNVWKFKMNQEAVNKMNKIQSSGEEDNSEETSEDGEDNTEQDTERGITKEDAETNEEDDETNEEDDETNEDDAETKEEDAETKEEDAETNEEDAETKEEDAETNEEDAETKEEDAETNEDDDETNKKIKISKGGCGKNTINYGKIKSSKVDIETMSFDFTTNILSIFEKVENVNTCLNEELKNSKSKYNELNSKYNELNSKYNIIKTKFDTMKSLFN